MPDLYDRRPVRIGVWAGSGKPQRSDPHIQGLQEDGEQDVALAAATESIAVQAGAENEIHAVPGHHHQREAAHRQDRQAEMADPAGESGVQDRQVPQQRNQGPDLNGT